MYQNKPKLSKINWHVWCPLPFSGIKRSYTCFVVMRKTEELTSVFTRLCLVFWQAGLQSPATPIWPTGCGFAQIWSTILQPLHTALIFLNVLSVFCSFFALIKWKKNVSVNVIGLNNKSVDVMTMSSNLCSVMLLYSMRNSPQWLISSHQLTVSNVTF